MIAAWAGVRCCTVHGAARAIVFATLGALCGCAHQYIDADGNRHIVGLVHVTLPATSYTGTPSIRTANIGLQLAKDEYTASLSFGLTETSLTFVGANSCAVLSSHSGTSPRGIP